MVPFVKQLSRLETHRDVNCPDHTLFEQLNNFQVIPWQLPGVSVMRSFPYINLGNSRSLITNMGIYALTYCKVQ